MSGVASATVVGLFIELKNKRMRQIAFVHVSERKKLDFRARSLSPIRLSSFRACSARRFKSPARCAPKPSPKPPVPSTLSWRAWSTRKQPKNKLLLKLKEKDTETEEIAVPFCCVIVIDIEARRGNFEHFFPKMAPRRLEFVRFLLYVSVPLTAFWWSNSAKNVQNLRDYVRFPFSNALSLLTRCALSVWLCEEGQRSHVGRLSARARRQLEQVNQPTGLVPLRVLRLLQCAARSAVARRTLRTVRAAPARAGRCRRSVVRVSAVDSACQ